MHIDNDYCTYSKVSQKNLFSIITWPVICFIFVIVNKYQKKTKTNSELGLLTVMSVKPETDFSLFIYGIERHCCSETITNTQKCDLSIFKRAPKTENNHHILQCLIWISAKKKKSKNGGDGFLKFWYSFF